MLRKLFISFIAGSYIYNLSASTDKPNFIVILTDDQTFRTINSLNNDEVKTPNIDRLVNRGTTFTHAFIQGSWNEAISVASRTMLITGQFLNNAAQNNDYLDSWARIKGISKDTKVTLFPEIFRNAGYRTFITGKWHNSDVALLKCFESGKAIGAGFYESYNSQRKALQYNRSDSKKWNPIDEKFGGHWTPLVRDIYREENEINISKPYLISRHTSEVYGNEAVSFLDSYNGLSPFFMYVAFNAPHDPRQSPKKYIEMYDEKKLSLPENYLSLHPFDQGDINNRDEQLAPFPRTEASILLHRSEYYAIISHMDNVIGRILDKIDELNIDDNTYIIFSSDNGLAIGEHGLMGKQNLYECSVRVPLIISGPGIKSGKTIDELVYMQSIYPTTCELAGLQIPETVDFKSLVPLLKSKKNKGEKYIWAGYKNYQRMIRNKEYKMILYPMIKKMQIFDINNDPFEINDLATNNEYRRVIKRLFKEMKKHQLVMGDTLNIGSLNIYYNQ